MVALRNYKPLHLMAGDGDDLNAISSCLQDAVLKVGDFAYLSEKRRFAFVANRFVWEASINRRVGPFARVRAGLHFDDVMSVRQKNIKNDADDAVVSLLAIRRENHENDSDENAEQTIVLEFSGGGIIQLQVEAINVQLDDISEPWQTRSRPDHQEK